MVMMNNLDRFHLVMDVIDRLPGLAPRAAYVRQQMADARLRARQHTRDAQVFRLEQSTPTIWHQQHDLDQPAQQAQVVALRLGQQAFGFAPIQQDDLA